MRLLTLLRRFVDRGDVKPHRVALVVPENRMETYSASTRFARALVETIEPAVGVGSSLGALALLHAQRLEPDAFKGLFLQSGSYFRRRSDPQESRFQRFGRIDRFVGGVLRGSGDPQPVPTTLTCALDEENYVNNAAVARALAEQGYPVEFHAARGGHDWPTWRRALELHLPALLRRAWR
jgi:enterochelin esterase family protein